MSKSPNSWKSFSAKLSPELAEEYDVRSIPVREGDTVIVMRGTFRDVEGKVTRVHRKKTSIFVEGITKEKADGNTIFVPLHPSKVRITKLNLDDDWRKDILARRRVKPSVEVVEKLTFRSRSSKKDVSNGKEHEDKE